jgi:hypothetical protein
LFVCVLGGDALSHGGSPASPPAQQSVAVAHQNTGAGSQAEATATSSDLTTSNALAGAPLATTASGAAAPTTAAAAAAAASQEAATSDTAADSAASPDTYALKSAESTTTTVTAPAEPPGLPQAPSSTSPAASHNSWRIAETALALLTAWLLAATLAVPILVRHEAGRDSQP